MPRQKALRLGEVTFEQRMTDVFFICHGMVLIDVDRISFFGTVGYRNIMSEKALAPWLRVGTSRICPTGLMLPDP